MDTMGHRSPVVPVRDRSRPVASPRMSELDPPPLPPPPAAAAETAEISPYPERSAPAPTPAPPPARADSPDGSRPGDLTFAWRCAVGIAWLIAFFAYAAVWQASVQLGIATWWIGPRSAPTSPLVRAIPFLLTILGIMLVIYNRRRLAQTTMVLAVISVLIAIPDFSRSVGLAVVEVMISVSMLVVGAAALTGRYETAAADADSVRPA